MIFPISRVVNENIKEFKSMNLWRSALAEMVGTGILVAIGCGSCLGDNWESDTSLTVQISFTFGFTVAVVVWSIGHLSGGHINPAVSIAMFFTRRITFVRLVLYIGVQMVGAILGALALKGVTPTLFRSQICPTRLSFYLTDIQGLTVEAFITFVLVLTVFACTDANRPSVGGCTPLAIGLAVFIDHLFAIKYTGSSINPARSFGSAVAGGVWRKHYIYWVGPIVGGLVASILYDFFLSVNSSLKKFTSYLSDPWYNPDIFHKIENKVSHEENDVEQNSSIF